MSSGIQDAADALWIFSLLATFSVSLSGGIVGAYNAYRKNESLCTGFKKGSFIGAMWIFVILLLLFLLFMGLIFFLTASAVFS